MQYIGELTAIAAASCWVVTAMVLASAGRSVGATVVNAVRIWIAIVLLLILVSMTTGTVWPEMSQASLLYLGLSGLIGLAIGDQFLYRALVDAGPRLSTLVMTITPALTAIIAFPVLNESLHGLDIIGMIITMLGIGIAVISKQDKNPKKPYPHLTRGIIFAFLGALGQAIGLILAKLGMEDSHVAPLSATYVRMCFGGIGATIMVAIYLMYRKPTEQKNRPQMSKVFYCILAGAVFGPVLGVWLGLISIKNIDTGIAATLMSISPILIIPFAKIFEKEEVTLRAVLGAAVSIVGVAILVLT